MQDFCLSVFKFRLHFWRLAVKTRIDYRPRRLVTAISAPYGAGFSDFDAGKLREGWFQTLPNPFSQDFAGRVFKARHLVEVVMIELLEEGVKGIFDVIEVH